MGISRRQGPESGWRNCRDREKSKVSGQEKTGNKVQQTVSKGWSETDCSRSLRSGKVDVAEQSICRGLDYWDEVQLVWLSSDSGTPVSTHTITHSIREEGLIGGRGNVRGGSRGRCDSTPPSTGATWRPTRLVRVSGVELTNK